MTGWSHGGAGNRLRATGYRPITSSLVIVFGIPALVFFVGGCAGSQDRAPATAMAEELPLPASPAQAQAELSRLEQQIQLNRQGLGLPVRPMAPTVMDGAGQAAVTEAEADEAPSASPAPEPAEAPRAVQASRSEGWSGDGRTKCSNPCRLARAICRAARRICNIADYLKDKTARSKCSQAKDDCNESREKAGRCPQC